MMLNMPIQPNSLSVEQPKEPTILQKYAPNLVYGSFLGYYGLIAGGNLSNLFLEEAKRTLATDWSGLNISQVTGAAVMDVTVGSYIYHKIKDVAVGTNYVAGKLLGAVGVKKSMPQLSMSDRMAYGCFMALELAQKAFALYNKPEAFLGSIGVGFAMSAVQSASIDQFSSTAEEFVSEINAKNSELSSLQAHLSALVKDPDTYMNDWALAEMGYTKQDIQIVQQEIEELTMQQSQLLATVAMQKRQMQNWGGWIHMMNDPKANKTGFIAAKAVGVALPLVTAKTLDMIGNGIGKYTENKNVFESVSKNFSKYYLWDWFAANQGRETGQLLQLKSREFIDSYLVDRPKLAMGLKAAQYGSLAAFVLYSGREFISNVLSSGWDGVKNMAHIGAVVAVAAAPVAAYMMSEKLINKASEKVTPKLKTPVNVLAKAGALYGIGRGVLALSETEMAQTYLKDHPYLSRMGILASTLIANEFLFEKATVSANPEWRDTLDLARGGVALGLMAGIVGAAVYKTN